LAPERFRADEQKFYLTDLAINPAVAFPRRVHRHPILLILTQNNPTTMHKLSLLFLLALIVLACGGGEDALNEAPSATAAKPAAKEINVNKIWKVRCIACHGLYGDMGTNGAANLQEVTSDIDYRINIITNGSANGIMTAFGEILDEAEIKAMAEYTMTFKKE
jgi:mono/diheme cytochrome c family protein